MNKAQQRAELEERREIKRRERREKYKKFFALYEEGLNINQIAKKEGVAYCTASLYVRRGHGIKVWEKKKPIRKYEEAQRLKPFVGYHTRACQLVLLYGFPKEHYINRVLDSIPFDKRHLGAFP